MAVKLKTPSEIEMMHQAGQTVCRVLEHLAELIAPGVTTAELDDQAQRMITQAGCEALFKGVPSPRAGYPFPASICVSIDNQVVHGIPSSKRKLEEGQLVSIDCGVRHKGYCGDAAVTIPVGQVGLQEQNLLDVTRQVLQIAVDNSRPGVPWSQIAAKMQACAEAAGFSVVRDFVGHGIGREMHEEPKLPNFVSRDLLQDDIVLQPGMVLAVEPMINMGRWPVKYGPDGWVVLTEDGLPSAHFEHTIAITDSGSEVLTCP